MTSTHRHDEADASEESFADLPDEIWKPICSKPATFSHENFYTVAENLIKNPNITSSCVFRADIYYDTKEQAPTLDMRGNESYDGLKKHMKVEFQPKDFSLPGYSLQRTVVRKMIPRNPSLDDALIQTCHFLSRSTSSSEEDTVFVMLPHASCAEEIPFYHPKVHGLAIRYTISPSSRGTLSIYYSLFPNSILDNRLERIAQNLLSIVHKHAAGQAAGYVKRVHHDLIVPQQRFQDTYTRLKSTYAKTLIASWAEVTDPTKHVFEDLGIAAFLIELWRDMYPATKDTTDSSSVTNFAGFVDIGCGNGVLVNILIQEGYQGWGFDARARKSWSTYLEAAQDQLQEKILVPFILDSSNNAFGYQNGSFPPGTFIISNHADELTPWTPLLAYLNNSSFIAIPCCSHNLAGARCRFNAREKSEPAKHNDTTEPIMQARKSEPDGSGPRTGSLARPKHVAKQPSAYQSLTAYVSNLSVELGFQVRKEMLRIPSTRNAAIVGRLPEDGDVDFEARKQKACDIVNREVGDIDTVSKDWMSRAEQIASNTSSGH